jgi:hypothetical protein
MNRKQYKIKRHSCALCKPHKMGWAPRFSDRQRMLMSVHSAEMRAAGQD